MTPSPVRVHSLKTHLGVGGRRTRENHRGQGISSESRMAPSFLFPVHHSCEKGASDVPDQKLDVAALLWDRVERLIPNHQSLNP